jgi:hypothetical protein
VVVGATPQKVSPYITQAEETRRKVTLDAVIGVRSVFPHLQQHKQALVNISNFICVSSSMQPRCIRAATINIPRDRNIT